MAEHDEHLSSLEHDINTLGSEPLDMVEATHLSDRTVDTVGKQFEHNPWVDYQQTGDNVTQSMKLSAELDPQVFIGKLKCLNEIQVINSYALDGPLDMQIPRVLVTWSSQNGETTQVHLKPNAPATAQSIQEVLGETPVVSEESVISGTQAMALQDALAAVYETAQQPYTHSRAQHPERLAPEYAESSPSSTPQFVTKINPDETLERPEESSGLN